MTSTECERESARSRGCRALDGSRPMVIVPSESGTVSPRIGPAIATRLGAIGILDERDVSGACVIPRSQTKDTRNRRRYHVRYSSHPFRFSSPWRPPAAYVFTIQRRLAHVQRVSAGSSEYPFTFRRQASPTNRQNEGLMSDCATTNRYSWIRL